MKTTGRPVYVAWTLIYAFALLATYRLAISPLFSYAGYTDGNPSAISLIFILSLCALPAAWLPKIFHTPTSVVVWLIYLIAYIPALLIPTLTGVPSGEVRYILIFAILAGMMIISWPSSRPIKLGIHPLEKEAFWLAVLAFSCISYLIIITSFGSSLSLPKLSQIYDVRAIFSEGLSRGLFFSGYAITWQANVINPLLLGFGTIYKRPWFLVAGVVGQLLIFSLTGFRSVALSIILIPALALLIHPKIKAHKLVASLFGVVVAAFVLDALTNSIEFQSLLVRRMIITPGLLTGYYIDFFSANPPMYLSHSFFASVAINPYQLTPPEIIGAAYFTNEGAYANANLFADGYANFGSIGIVLASLLLRGVFSIIDGSQNASGVTGTIHRKDFQLRLSLLLIPTITLTNSGLLTTIGNHGLGLALVLLILLPSEKAFRTR